MSVCLDGRPSVCLTHPPRAHFHVQELFVEPQQLAQYAAGLQGGPAQYGGMGMAGGFDQSGKKIKKRGRKKERKKKGPPLP